MKIRKSAVVLVVVLLGLAVLVRYVFRDIRLDVDLLRETLEKIPNIVLENLEFEREISGDYWQVAVPRASRHEGTVEVLSVEIRRWQKNGREWYFRSARGVYREQENVAELERLLGTLEMGGRVLNLESPGLFWSGEREEFLFSKGLTLYDDEFILKTPLASIDASGVVLLEKGGRIRWTRRTR